MAVLSEQLRLGESEMKKTVISLLAFAVTTGTAWADTAPTQTGKDNRVAAREFKSMDLNNDGAISREEAARNSELKANFDKYAENHDVRLIFGEFAHFEGAGRAGGGGGGAPRGGGAGGAAAPP